jgi:dTDP-4-amino-4,6-dideoxygalactose transaminase
MNTNRIPFNKPYMTGKELYYIAQANFGGMLSGDGPFSDRCHRWIEREFHTGSALLTHSCTAALEMAALLLDIQPGDEVIMPSYTFASTANAFVLRGAHPVFVDIRADTLNIDERLVEAAITPRTKAIVPVHYAGVACEMDAIMEIALRHGLSVVEDAAQGFMSLYKGRALGTIGGLGTLSFHETKNIISGEGGALLVNDTRLTLDAEIVREKGTDRSRFFRGEVDKYTWQQVGSSFLCGELVAAFLWAQLEEASSITDNRLEAWNIYDSALKSLSLGTGLQRPFIPEYCTHNGHMYFVIIPPGVERRTLLDRLKVEGIMAVSHYVPLHSSPAGVRYGRPSGTLGITDSIADRLIRLPLWVGITEQQQYRVVEALSKCL